MGPLYFADHCLQSRGSFKFCEKSNEGYYYDGVKKECLSTGDEQHFVCNDGPNRFALEAFCMAFCVQRSPPMEDCNADVELIPCHKKHLKKTWCFYDGAKCAEWGFETGECPRVADYSMQYNTEAQCRSHCNGPSAFFFGCYAPGSGDACPVDVILTVRHRQFFYDDDSSMMRTWTMLAWRFVLTLALLLLALYLIVSGMVWAARQAATRKQRATDVSLKTGLSRSADTSVTVTTPGPDPDHTSKKTDIETTSSTAENSPSDIATTTTTTTDKTITTPLTTEEDSTITTRPTTITMKTTATHTTREETTTTTTTPTTTTIATTTTATTTKTTASTTTTPTTATITTTTKTTKTTSSTATTPTTTTIETTTKTTKTTGATATTPITKMKTTTTTRATKATTTTPTTTTPPSCTTTKKLTTTTTAKPTRRIGNCTGKEIKFEFCEKPIPGSYADMVEEICRNVTDDVPFLCNDGHNRFRSADECHKQCMERNPPEKLCEDAPDLIPCQSKHLRRTWWFYNWGRQVVIRVPTSLGTP
ncbi:uncharacterized protein LOC144124238 [Amblyomma americanum]